MSGGHGAGDGGSMGVALSTALLAVLIAITHLYEGKFHSLAILAQGEETDQWAYYQAKSLKQHTYDIQLQALEVEEAALPRSAAAAHEKFRVARGSFESKSKKYESEKEEIKKKAEEIAGRKHLAHHRAEQLGYGLLFLEISIMLASISTLAKKPALWYASLALIGGWAWFVVRALEVHA